MIVTLQTPDVLKEKLTLKGGSILGLVDKVVFAIPRSVGYRCDRKLVAH